MIKNFFIVVLTICLVFTGFRLVLAQDYEKRATVNAAEVDNLRRRVTQLEDQVMRIAGQNEGQG